MWYIVEVIKNLSNKPKIEHLSVFWALQIVSIHQIRTKPTGHIRANEIQIKAEPDTAETEEVDTHTQMEEKSFQCTHCDKSFSQIGHLQRHIRTHTGQKPFHCKNCEKSFSDSGDLRRHERTHSGDKPFKCDQCDRWFRQRCHLKDHKKFHSGERPFECKMCEKAFTTSGSLKNHERIHSRERPYMCLECGKCFTEAGTLKRHQRTHSNEKPYGCQKCGKHFTRKETLKLHQRKSNCCETPNKKNQITFSLQELSKNIEIKEPLLPKNYSSFEEQQAYSASSKE
ncbi:zinc finger protein 664-like isoform X1 [Montipora foliosa]|uniref:zinc finger protein 664-like isoform X1 n=1 Tax=Montipora foliosa TaxID=591990 RepID=UPI0035F18C39